MIGMLPFPEKQAQVMELRTGYKRHREVGMYRLQYTVVRKTNDRIQTIRFIQEFYEVV